MPSHPWARNFTVTDDDLEYLTNLLLERETPLTTEALASALIERRLAQEASALRERYQDTKVYNPARSYQVGDRVVFPALDYGVAEVEKVRPGNNPAYGEFEVISVAFDDANGERAREFAARLTAPHKLSEATSDDESLGAAVNTSDPAEILAANQEEIVDTLFERLQKAPELVIVAGHWFPRDLILEVNEGHLNLAEAVLDLAEGGPIEVDSILAQIGGLGEGPKALQEFSLNYALNQDDRFDEVGPAGQVLWYLSRLEPPDVLNTPPMLVYHEIDYDRRLLTPDMLALEAEINDEHSSLKAPPGSSDEAITMTLIYPHRRCGTLPLNAKMRRIFPTARRTSRIWITLVDGQDGEEFEGWVVRGERYVYGLAPLYRKHRLPVGAYVQVSQGEYLDQMVVNFAAHRPRTEWIRLIVPKGNQIGFENHKRAIGAEYDDLMILGADDLPAVDALFQATQQSHKGLKAIVHNVLAELSRLTPQGTAHAKTIYSAVNVVRRCPPGPIFATLASDPDFENVGNHYWKLSTS